MTTPRPARLFAPALGALATALLACGSGDDTPQAGASTTVTAFTGEHVYFGDPNRRTVDAEVTFPPAGLRYASVTLRLDLGCPTGGCDWWDRLGHLSIVRPGVDGGEPVELEVARFITPYRVGGQFTVDVTDLQRLLEGPQTVRVFIDTWVGPGHANGAGWLVDAAFDFVGGIPTPDPFAVMPLWSPHRIVYGDPARPIDVQATVDVPAGATTARVRALVTGHGQGNADNCGEFCRRDHTIELGDQPSTIELWRDDCATTAAPGQQGTWRYARAGWCPGAMVRPWIVDGAAAPGPLVLRHRIEDYVNTCRPEASPCTGCTLGTGCAYDDGAHNEQGWEQSALLILER
jgi:hypothetical protein